MPMAGLGSRYSKYGIDTPKPLIEVSKTPLYINALKITKYLDNVNIKYTFIIRDEFKKEFLNSVEDNFYDLSNVNIISLDHVTRGSVETVMQSFIYDDEALLIMDCDLYANSIEYCEFIKNALASNTTGGAVLSFESNLPKYSYAEIDTNNNVIRTAEKQVISNHALAGMYFFASGKEFIDAANRLLDSTLTSEYYVSLLYNDLILHGSNVKLFYANNYISYGTLDEYTESTQTDIIITDFDGTLVDTFEANAHAYEQAFNECELEFNKELYKENFGLRYNDMLKVMGVPEEYSSVIRILKAKYYPSYFNYLKLNEELYNYIKEMHLSGIKTCIASTARRENLMNVLNYLNISETFDKIISGEDVHEGKPNPEIYIKATLGYHNPIIFEDSYAGLTAAKQVHANVMKIKL